MMFIPPRQPGWPQLGIGFGEGIAGLFSLDADFPEEGVDSAGRQGQEAGSTVYDLGLILCSN